MGKKIFQVAKNINENGTSQEKKILLSIFLHTQKHNVPFIWVPFLNELSYNNEFGPNCLHFSRWTLWRKEDQNRIKIMEVMTMNRCLYIYVLDSNDPKWCFSGKNLTHLTIKLHRPVTFFLCLWGDLWAKLWTHKNHLPQFLGVLGGVTSTATRESKMILFVHYNLTVWLLDFTVRSIFPPCLRGDS